MKRMNYEMVENLLGRLSQGQYGNIQAIPRILKILEDESVAASFFVPAVTALAVP
jgi:hypothetical protein